MSRKPEDIKDWEKVLREGSFDFPEATWQRLENDMRGFLAAEARIAAQPKPIAWHQKFLGWVSLPSARWGIGLASLGLVLAAFWGRGAMTATSGAFAWAPGQILESSGHQEWNWKEGRCKIQGDNTRLLLRQASATGVEIELERGQATFQVDHRKSDETFSVKVGDCNVQVVGTTFTVGIDSLKQWVSVEEGKIRFQSLHGQRYVAKGQTGICRELGMGQKQAVALESTQVAPLEPAGETAIAVKPVAEKPLPAAEEITVPVCLSGEACIPQLAKFVRSYPNHGSASEIALRWARLASAQGDYRDALIAYGFAANRNETSSIARLESFQIRVRGLGQTAQVVDSLDHWIPTLPKGSATWREALSLRKEVARRAGDNETSKRIDTQLQSLPQAQSGSR